MRTIIELPEGLFMFRRKFYGTKDLHTACSKCALNDSGSLFCCECNSYDTEKYAIFLEAVELATPSIGSDTPSEARREAANK